MIAHSNEAKALGIEMGAPWHLHRDRFAAAGVIVRSSDYKLYGDMSARVMEVLRGSYLFEDDPKRILQDPESMRASYIRQGAAWQAWAASEGNSLPPASRRPEKPDSK